MRQRLMYGIYPSAGEGLVPPEALGSVTKVLP